MKGLSIKMGQPTIETVVAMAILKKKMKEKDNKTSNNLFTDMKAMHRQEQTLSLERPLNPSSSNPIDYNAFNIYGPD